MDFENQQDDLVVKHFEKQGIYHDHAHQGWHCRFCLAGKSFYEV
jgi:hypothetical protein